MTCYFLDLEKTQQHHRPSLRDYQSAWLVSYLQLHQGTTFEESSFRHYGQSPCNLTRFPYISLGRFACFAACPNMLDKGVGHMTYTGEAENRTPPPITHQAHHNFPRIRTQRLPRVSEHNYYKPRHQLSGINVVVSHVTPPLDAIATPLTS
jgi:hypothetical protein